VDQVNRNYTTITHDVVTDDGFILRLFRIEGNETEKPHDGEDKPKPAVLLQHGLLSSSETWIQNGDNSLAFKLLEAGFDVWLGNNRGNIYSRRHQTLAPSGQEYFDFSFYEYGLLDLPAMVDYIRNATKQSKISYIGHSLGTAQMFSALSINAGDLRNKINAYIAMAPITRLDHTTN
jgi:pimeloyl-ACP methyl ester carboxylesterase